MNENQAYLDALALPKGKYLTPDMAKASGNNGILVNMMNRGKTNATSTYPILGTCALDPCTGIAMWNKRTKELIIGHEPVLFVHEYQRRLNDIRDNDTDQLEIHVIGANPASEDDIALGGDNEETQRQLAQLAQAIADTPNATLKTFDVYDKPHPSDFAVDARNGRLIRGTLDMTDIAFDMDDWECGYMRDWDVLEHDFDGTLPDYQAKAQQKG